MIMIYPSEITKKWPHRPLSEVVDFLDSKRKPITQKDRVPGPYPYYGANGQQDSVADYIFDEPLVLLAEDGGHFGDADKTIAYQVEGKCWVNNHAHVLRPKKDVDIRYICRHLERYDVTPFITGSTRGKLTKTAANNIPIALPPLEEQRRIAAILDKADGVRRKRKEAIRLTDELLKSTFLEMFGDPVTNPKGWEVRELGDCVKDIESGWSPKCDTRQAEPEEWGVLKLGAVTYGHFNPDENKAMLPDDVPRQELEIKTGDLLVTRKNTYELVGASAFVQMTRPKLMLPDLIFRLRLIDGIDPVYVWQTLSQKTMRLKLSGLAGGTAGSMPNISKARLRTLPFPVPPQLLQLKYREIFNQFWLKKEHQKESEEISENLFNSLLQRAFRGEL
ncbi:putative type I restriction enzyme specificity protein [Microcystis viridis NIES-102]|jgi:type I restriction enzyme S subunit|uniref:Putative type I restriction enzyme specificity protein n=2 Tax=Microcystis TaxID=1125 RepID=A0A3G9K535_MICVR|nr:restriction endonuclease subunit S [Microcystis viridis]BBH42644.1 putative type I restriction enzyme specificity protein [Microcystis viridis NIES-102]